MIKTSLISDFLTEYDIQRLSDCCKKDDLVTEFLNEVYDIVFWRSLNTTVKPPPHWIKWFEKRRKVRCRSDIDKEIKRAINILDELSTPVLQHIIKDQTEWDAYHSVLHALKRPYVPKKKHSDKDRLIKDIKQLITKYDIDASRNRDSDLVLILDIIITAAALPHEVDDIARGIVEFG